MRWMLLMICIAGGSLSAAGSEIHDAVKAQDLERVKKLIEKDPSYAVDKDGDSVTPLHLAAGLGLKEIVKVLLDNKAQVNARTLALETPLHRACVNGNKDVVKMLLDQGAELELQARFGGTPLHNAAENGHKKAVEMLIQAKADVNARNAMGKTPLDLATEKKHAQVVELLQKNGGKPAPGVK